MSSNAESNLSNAPQKKRGPRIQSGWGSSNPTPKSSSHTSTTTKTSSTLIHPQNPLVEENKPIFITSTKENEKFIVYQEGLVLIKKCISFEMQQKLANDCIAIGVGDVPGIPSFYDGKTTTVSINKDAGYAHISYEEDKNDDTNDSSHSNKNQLNMLNKARVVIQSEQLPSYWLQLCDEYLKMAINLSPDVPYTVPKMCSVNYYTNSAKIGWHTDKVIGVDMKDQAKITSPIISFFLLVIHVNFGIKIDLTKMKKLFYLNREMF